MCVRTGPLWIATIHPLGTVDVWFNPVGLSRI